MKWSQVALENQAESMCNMKTHKICARGLMQTTSIRNKKKDVQTYRLYAYIWTVVNEAKVQFFDSCLVHSVPGTFLKIM